MLESKWEAEFTDDLLSFKAELLFGITFSEQSELVV